jgi:hypothetical protein
LPGDKLSLCDRAGGLMLAAVSISTCLGVGPRSVNKLDGAEAVSDDYLNVLVEFYARHVIAVEKIAAHVDDGTGHCCVCSAGGTQTGRYSYPCSIRLAADAARQQGAP